MTDYTHQARNTGKEDWVESDRINWLETVGRVGMTEEWWVHKVATKVSSCDTQWTTGSGNKGVNTESRQGQKCTKETIKRNINI